VAFAREVVGRGGERAVRPLAQRRLGRVELDILVGDRVRGADSGCAGVDVTALPGREDAVCANRATVEFFPENAEQASLVGLYFDPLPNAVHVEFH